MVAIVPPFCRTATRPTHWGHDARGPRISDGWEEPGSTPCTSGGDTGKASRCTVQDPRRLGRSQEAERLSFLCENEKPTMGRMSVTSHQALLFCARLTMQFALMLR